MYVLRQARIHSGFFFQGGVLTFYRYDNFARDYLCLSSRGVLPFTQKGLGGGITLFTPSPEYAPVLRNDHLNNHVERTHKNKCAETDNTAARRRQSVIPL